MLLSEAHKAKVLILSSVDLEAQSTAVVLQQLTQRRLLPLGLRLKANRLQAAGAHSEVWG